MNYTLKDHVPSIAALAAAIGTNTQPDLVNSGFISLYYYANTIQPFDEYIRKDSEYPVEDLHRINDWCKIDGKQYGLTSCVYAFLLAWNKDYFDDHNLDREAYPKTWADMLEYQSALTDYDDKGIVTRTGFVDMLYYTSPHCYPCFYKGEQAVNPPGYYYNVNTEGMYQAFEWYFAMEDAFGGRANLGKNISGLANSHPKYFLNGDVAMIHLMFPNIILGAPFDVGFAPVPNHQDADREYYYVNFDDVHMLARNATNPDGAWFYLKWYLTSGILQVAEGNDYDEDPINYFPRFYTHSYTRQRCYDLYLNEDTPQTILDAVVMRDAVMEKANCYESVPVTVLKNNIYVELQNGGVGNRGKIGALREYLAGVQKTADIMSEKWLDEMADKGWVIDTDLGVWGYYAGE